MVQALEVFNAIFEHIYKVAETNCQEKNGELFITKEQYVTGLKEKLDGEENEQENENLDHFVELYDQVTQDVSKFKFINIIFKIFLEQNF